MNIRLFTIPNLLTLANLLSGAAAVVAVLVHHSYETALWLIVAAAVFDFFDGFAARLLKQTSPLGIELDSLADDISFGLVPAVMMFDIFNHSQSLYGLNPEVMSYAGYATFLIAAFSALRLARFNIDTTQSSEFRGLPTPANALMIASLALLFEQGRVELMQEHVLVISLAAAMLLVSPIRMFALKFKGFGIRGNELRYGFMLVSLLLIIFIPTYSILAIIVLYIVLSTLRWMFTKSQGGENNK
ncbi:MAG: CDP-diacylglycerol--serine O-phosphatidyltransferase [Alistipes sp.]|nr:CDP-diacylglycerol--serine O-phosphatidyltransferase [Alistipes sp.]